jgi:hypothetical protein
MGYEAPLGTMWVCGACGKTGLDRRTIGDEACFINAVLCYIKDVPESALKKTLAALVLKLDIVENSPEYRGVWDLYYAHGGVYKGPQYTMELAEARKLLEEI